MKPEKFIDIIVNKVVERVKQPVTQVRFATIDPAYTTGRPRLTFDGEDSPTVKGYSYASSYTPAPNDRVMVLNNVILCKII